MNPLIWDAAVSGPKVGLNEVMPLVAVAYLNCSRMDFFRAVDLGIVK